jgi:hypothetical protein
MRRVQLTVFLSLAALLVVTFGALVMVREDAAAFAHAILT